MVVNFFVFVFKFVFVVGILLMFGMILMVMVEKYVFIVIDFEIDEVLYVCYVDVLCYLVLLIKVMMFYMLFDVMKSGEVKLYE